MKASKRTVLKHLAADAGVTPAQYKRFLVRMKKLREQDDGETDTEQTGPDRAEDTESGSTE